MLQLGVDAKSEPRAEAAASQRPSYDLIPGLGAKEIDRELRLADRQSDVGTRRLAFYLADMETRGICQLLGYATATVYAVKRLEMGRRHAQQLIAAGRALEELPRIDAAFCEGKLNWSRVRLLTKIAVRETEAAWLERALALSLGEFEREILTSEKGRPPRTGRKGLPQVKIGIAAKVDRLLYEKWELAKRKLGDERGEPATDADLMECAAHLMLSTGKDGTVPGRSRLNDSIYRIVVDRCSECEASYLQTAEGPANLPNAVLEAIECDAKVEIIEDEEPGERTKAQSEAASADHQDHADPTPPWMRTQVLIRDGYACRVCGGSLDVQAHHVNWRSMSGRTKPSNLSGTCSRCHALIHENLLFVSGVAPHGLQITDREGNPLDRSPEAIGAQVRRLPSLAGILDEPSECRSTLPAVTFQTLPVSTEANWFSRHVNLFKWNGNHGEMEFEPGSPVEPSPPPEEIRKPILDQVGEPIALENLIGQARVVQAFVIALAAAQMRRKPLGHALLLGPPGLGKSTLARAVANQMGCAVSMTTGPLIKDPSVLIKLLTGLTSGQVLFIDEIHGLPRAAAETLYEAMEEGVLRLPVTDGHRSKTIQIALHPFTLIGATTELGRVPGPLQSRFRIREYLDLYADQDLGEMVKRAVARDGLSIEEDAAARVAKLSHGVPRDAIKLSARIQDLALARGTRTIDRPFVENALRAYGIDERGLGTIERKALSVLERHGRGRPMGISRWSAASGLCMSVLRQVCEPALIRLGLIAVTPRGRMAVA